MKHQKPLIDFDIVILGGGMVGAALACALGNSRLKVCVLDSRVSVASVSEDYDPRVSVLTLASRALFKNLGAWEAMQHRRVVPIEAMQVWDQEQGEIHFDAAEIGEPCLSYVVENNVIQQALIERLHNFTNVHCLWPTEVNTITFGDDVVTVTLKDGRCLQTRLLVGADGANSVARGAAGIKTHQLDLNQKGIVATVRTEKSHRRTAYQRFLPTGPLAFLPLLESNVSSIVWSVDTARADVLLALDDAAFSAELQIALGDRLGCILSVSRRQAFVLGLAHAQAYTAPRLALVGDAAHMVHPLAGQGLNLGLLDAAVLAELLLKEALRGRNVGAHSVLRRYERRRKGDNLSMIAMTGGFKYLFGATWPLVCSARNIGLDFTHAITPLKRFIMRRASGLEGDVPTLARSHV